MTKNLHQLAKDLDRTDSPPELDTHAATECDLAQADEITGLLLEAENVAVAQEQPGTA